MKLKSTMTVIFLLVVLFGLFPTDAQACAACFGASDSQLAKGMNAGIMVLLMVVSAVLFMLSVFFIYLWKRAIAFQSEIPGDNPSDSATN